MPEDEKGKAVPKGCREVACDINGHRVAILERVYGDAQVTLRRQMMSKITLRGALICNNCAVFSGRGG